MKSIEIYINNIGQNINILIDVKNNNLTLNDKLLEITKEQINDLLRIIRTWNNVYEKHNKNIDSESFLIKIIEENNIDTIEGKGTYPKNYHELKRWIGDINA